MFQVRCVAGRPSIVQSLSVVVPCYNEAAGIPQLKEQLLPVLERLSDRYAIELILVDDGSTDDTHALLGQAFAGFPTMRVIRHERNLNVGGAIRTGVRESTGNWIAFLDSDCTYRPELLEEMLPLMETGADLVTTSPYHPDGRVDGVPPNRLILSKGLTAIYRAILHKRIYTFTAMVRVFRRSIYERIKSPAHDFNAIAEMLLKALKADLVVVELPAVLTVRRYGQSKMKIIKVIMAHLAMIARLVLRPNSFS